MSITENVFRSNQNGKKNENKKQKKKEKEKSNRQFNDRRMHNVPHASSSRNFCVHSVTKVKVSTDIDMKSKKWNQSFFFFNNRTTSKDFNFPKTLFSLKLKFPRKKISDNRQRISRKYFPYNLTVSIYHERVIQNHGLLAHTHTPPKLSKELNNFAGWLIALWC